MAINLKKGYHSRVIRYSSEKEYKKLIDALNEGRNDDVLNIIFNIFQRGDLL